MINVALVLFSATSDNFGVGALGVSQVSILREIAKDARLDIRIIVVDSPSNRKPYIFGDDVDVVVCRPLRRPREFFKVLAGSDVILDIGGGDSFSDIYGRRRIIQFLWMKLMSLVSGAAVVLAPQTFGPFKSPFFARLALSTIRHSRIVSTRDSWSASYLRELGFRGEIIEASDIALRLPSVISGKLTLGKGIRIGMNVSGLLARGGYDGKNMFGLKFEYLDLVRSLLKGFEGREDVVEIHLVPHVFSSSEKTTEDDLSICSELQAEYSKAVLAPSFGSPSEAKGYISQLDFFIGARMHSCIAAFSTGVPFVPLAYSRKFAGLFGTLNYHETVDCTSVSLEQAVDLVFSSFERRHTLTQIQSVAYEEGLHRVALFEKSLSDLLTSL